MVRGHKQSDLVTLVERRSGYLLAARLPKLSAELMQRAMIRLLKPRRGSVQTIILDNGSEFADHETVAQALTAAMYFCHLYCSRQRGTNENTNGLIRQYFPKGTDFRQVSYAKLRKVVEKLNDRARKPSDIAYRHRCFWENIQAPWIPQVLRFLLEFRRRKRCTINHLLR